MLTLKNYQKKGIYAYLAPIVINRGKIERQNFINGTPIEEGDNKARYFAGKIADVSFDLSTFVDGWYEVKSAGFQGKVNVYYIEIEEGIVVNKVKNQGQLMRILVDLPKLPPLDSNLGTDKQIKFAEDVRYKALLQMQNDLSATEFNVMIEALWQFDDGFNPRWWIDHREDILSAIDCLIMDNG